MDDLLLTPELIMLCILGGLLLLLGFLYLVRQLILQQSSSSFGTADDSSSSSEYTDDVSTHKSIPLGIVAREPVPRTSVQILSRAEGRQSPVIEITPAMDDPLEVDLTPSSDFSGSPFFKATDAQIAKVTYNAKDSSKKEAEPKQTTQNAATTKPTKSPPPKKPTAATKEPTTPTKPTAEKKVSTKPPSGKKDIGVKVAVRNVTKVTPYTPSSASKR